MPRRDYTKVAFAATGDTATIPGTTQPDGSVSMPQGFGFDYERDNGAGGGTPDPLAKNIEREDMNGILNEITASVGEIQQNGLAIWAATGAPYPINAQVRHNDLNWQSLITNNNEEPGTGSNWRDVSALPQGGLLNIQYFRTVGANLYTPTPGTKSVEIELLGAGGGGGGVGATPSGSTAGPGGGGGRYVKRRLTSNFSGATINVGAPGGGGVGGNGGNGASTTFVPLSGPTLTAPGGGGGGVGGTTTVNVITTGTPGQGGVNTDGDLGRDGGAGGIALIGPNFVLSGAGGDSFFGAGAPYGSLTGAGVNAGVSASVNSGGGGAGAVGLNNGSPAAGGSGGSGWAAVREYS